MVDYLRFVAFNGSLRNFFTEGLAKFAKVEHTTGLHLRFDPKHFEIEHLRWLYNYHWQSRTDLLAMAEYRELMGVPLFGDSLLTMPNLFEAGKEPATHAYKENTRLNRLLQIIIDIHPEYWNENYNEGASYNEIKIVFRRSGPAIPHTPVRVFGGINPKNFGTLCGYFRTDKDKWYALTCAHVVNNASIMSIKKRMKFWRFSWMAPAPLGRCVDSRSFSTARTPFEPTTDLDAALIEASPRWFPESADSFEAVVKPISTIAQEEPVSFHGSSRMFSTQAKVAAITVRKSIDMLKNGTLHEVGDVLMLGHVTPMYIAQRVSRPGDSGAAVRQHRSNVGPAVRTKEWYGMILGSDDSGAYASYGEHLYAWVQHRFPNDNLRFYFCR